MNDLLTYFIQSGLNLAILFGIFWIFLNRDTFYQINRYYLLGSLVISLVFPLIKIPLGSGSASYIYMLKPIVIAPQVVAEQMNQRISAGNLVMMIYLAGSVFFLTRFAHQLIRFAFLINQYGVTRYRGLKLVIMDQDYVPFSLFNLVFIQRDLFKNPDFEKIIEHERTHVKEYHSLDLIIVELFIILQWFNPFIWMTRKSLKSIHEYIADRGVLSKGYPARDYQQLLLNQTFGTRFITLSNNFNQSLIKKRFIMMSKQRTKGMSMLKLVIIIPAAAVLSILFTISYSGTLLGSPDVPAAIEVLQPETIVVAAPQEEPVFTVVEQMPKYPGGEDALVKYLSENIKYPENARKKGIQGTVFVTFVVEKDGKVSNARVLRGVDTELDKEALRVVSEMPKWFPGKEGGKPVKVQYNLPIAYKLDAGKKESDTKAETPKRREEVKKIDK